MLKGQPERPANMLEIVQINQGRKPYSDELADPPGLSPEEAASAIDRGVPVLDIRNEEDYGDGHIPGSFFVPSRTKTFEQYAGWILPVSSPFLMAVDENEDIPDALSRLAIVGLDLRVQGIVSSDEWQKEERPLARVGELDVKTLYDRKQRTEINVLDVRDASEWKNGHIEGAIHINFKHLGRRWEELLECRNDPLAVICDSGMRSMIACGILQRHQFTTIYNVRGGMGDWSSQDLPVVNGD